jgi:peroxiredoxin
MTDRKSSSAAAKPKAPTGLLVAAYGFAGALIVTVVVLFAVALPDATARAREGRRKTLEAPCEELQPTSVNAALGRLPAPAPDFALKDYLGRELRLSSLRGNVVLVNFWATWCKTCVVEMPSMEKLVERMRGKPFRLLAVSVDESWKEVREFFAQGTPLDIYLDIDRAVPRAYGTEKFPESFLIDKNGEIRYYIVSDRDWTRPEVAACIEALARE